MKGIGNVTGRGQGKGETEELWGKEAVIQKATNSKDHKTGGRCDRIKSQEAMSQHSHLQTSSRLSLGGRCQHCYWGYDCRHRAVDSRGDKMKITVTRGHVFLKGEVNVTWRFLLCESLCTLMGKLEM